jgi:hypothetical protein
MWTGSWRGEMRSPWWWRQQAPLQRRSTFTRLHGATTQKTNHLLTCGLEHKYFTITYFYPEIPSCVKRNQSEKTNNEVHWLSQTYRPIIWIRLKSLVDRKTHADNQLVYCPSHVDQVLHQPAKWPISPWRYVIRNVTDIQQRLYGMLLPEY